MRVDPKMKPRLWNIKPGIVAYNCQRAGLPMPVLAMPMWESAGDRAMNYANCKNQPVFTNTPEWKHCGLYLTASEQDSLTIANNDLSNNFPGKINSHCTALVGATIDHIDGTYSNMLVFGSSIYLMYRNGANGCLNASVGGANPTSTTALEDGVFNHWGMVYNGVNIQLYVNGKADGNSVPLAAFPTSSDAFYIGTRADGASNRSVNGLIAYVYIWACELTSKQVFFVKRNPDFMFRQPEVLFGYVAGGPPPETSIPALMNYYRQLRVA